jgi:hypothetical protein
MILETKHREDSETKPQIGYSDRDSNAAMDLTTASPDPNQTSTRPTPPLWIETGTIPQKREPPLEMSRITRSEVLGRSHGQIKNERKNCWRRSLRRVDGSITRHYRDSKMLMLGRRIGCWPVPLRRRESNSTIWMTITMRHEYIC